MNIAEILKDCPKGTKLYSPICGECELVSVTYLHIDIQDEDKYIRCFRFDGTVANKGECLLFPSKENRDWSTFQRPFKDGDIIYIETHKGFKCISIFKKYSETEVYTYVGYSLNTDTYIRNHPERILTFINIKYKRLATEEEKQKLFDAIKTNGYKWNTETKTLEKLIVPKFKVGDRIKNKYTCEVVSIVQVREFDYIATIGDAETAIKRKFEDHYELVSNKFDITTLKPFDKVLVRDYKDRDWTCSIFSHLNNGTYSFSCINTCYICCIPYNDATKHLLGTTNDCDEYYKTW